MMYIGLSFFLPDCCSDCCANDNFLIWHVRDIENSFHDAIDHLADLIKHGKRDITFSTSTQVSVMFAHLLREKLASTTPLQRLFGNYTSGDIMGMELKQRVMDEIGHTVKIRFEPVLTDVNKDGFGTLMCRIIID